MSAYMLRKRIFTVLFLVVLFGYSGINALHGYPAWLDAVEDTWKDQEAEQGPVPDADRLSELVADLDAGIVENMYHRMDFIETYSWLQVLLDKREVNNFSYIKDEKGFLHYASFFREDDERIPEYARRVKRLQDCVADRGTKVIFFVTPGKYIKGESVLRRGLPVNDPDTVVDELLFYLNRFGVETIDGRMFFPNDELSGEEAFFRTDHHWTIPAAFYASQVFVEEVKARFGDDWDPGHYYMDRANYDSVVYRRGMFGSMGRKTGANFCDVEDFEAYWPKFTRYYERGSMGINDEMEELSGDTTEALMDVGILSKGEDIYSDSQYFLYLDGIRPYEKIINTDNPEGYKVCAIRDSYFSPMIVFMMPMWGELHAIWSLEESDRLDIEDFVKDNEFDYIIVEIYPYNINEESFRFFEEDEAEIR